MPSTGEVENFLGQYDIEVLRFTERTPDAESAARTVGCAVAEIAKSLLVNVGGKPILVVTCGDTKINSSRLKRALKLSGKVRFAAADEVKVHTGYAPGGVTPFLLPKELPVILDHSMRRFPVTYPAAGDDYSTVSVTVEQLLQFTGGEEANVCDLLD